MAFLFYDGNLPDRDHETIVKGHQLKPRFQTYVDGDVTEVVAVFRNDEEMFKWTTK